MARSLVTIDLGAIRHNARSLRDVLGPDGALGGRQGGRLRARRGGRGARRARGRRHRALRRDGGRGARAAGGPSRRRGSSCSAPRRRRRWPGRARPRSSWWSPPSGCRRACRSTSSSTPGWAAGGSRSCPSPDATVVGLMTHLATADTDRSFAREQLDRFLRATEPYAGRYTRHAANSAAALAMPETRLDAARCGIALYGIDPEGEDARRFGLEPALRWESELAQVRRLAPGDSTGYGRRFVATEETWIGIVPVGYADGFRRDLTGAEVAGRGASRARRRHGLHGRPRRPAAGAGRAGHARDPRRRRRDARGARAGRGDDRATSSRVASGSLRGGRRGRSWGDRQGRAPPRAPGRAPRRARGPGPDPARAAPR